MCAFVCGCHATAIDTAAMLDRRRKMVVVVNVQCAAMSQTLRMPVESPVGSTASHRIAPHAFGSIVCSRDSDPRVVSFDRGRLPLPFDAMRRDSIPFGFGSWSPRPKQTPRGLPVALASVVCGRVVYARFFTLASSVVAVTRKSSRARVASWSDERMVSCATVTRPSSPRMPWPMVMSHSPQ